jgi:subtilisin-like proprotein convertase family protein
VATVAVGDCCVARQAASYPVAIPVNIAGSVSKVTVTLNGLTHADTADLDVLLVGPGAGAPRVLLMSDAGLSASNATVTFDDAASGPIGNAPLVSGASYQPTNGNEDCSSANTGDAFPGLAAGPYSSTLAPFNGTSPTGTWNLYLVDDCQVDSGSLAGGVTLSISTGGAPTAFTVAAPVTVSDCCAPQAAAPNPSTITLQNVTGQINGISVNLNGLTHPYAADLNALLVGPTGEAVVLMSDVGRAASGANLVFSDAAGGPVPNGAIPAGTSTYQPTDLAEDCAGPPAPDVFPAAPAGSYGSALNVFNGTDPNGVWSLYLSDDCGGDAGQLTSGWSLDIATGPTAVTVTRFTAARTRAGVSLNWRTAQETSLLGFNVYRVVAGKLTKLNRTVLAHRGRGVRGAAYSLLDSKAPTGRPVSFRLQAVGLDGKRSWQGVARVKTGRATKGFHPDLVRKTPASQLTLACALRKNGLLRAVSSLGECRKLETAVTVSPGPTYVCVQADGSSRKVAAPGDCIAPGTLLTLPANNDEYFCAGADGVLTHETSQGNCGAQTELVVTHTNSAPTNVALSPAAVAENQPSGTTVGTLSSTDPNAGDTFTYTFAGGANDSSFAITGTTLTTSASFNFEAKSSYAITIRSTDQSGAFFDKPLTVSVTNVNEAPVNTVPGAQSVNEDTDLSFAGTLSVADPDAATTPATAITVQTTVSALNGTITPATGSGATVTGSGTSSAVITGTTTQVNAALNGLKYRGTANYNSTRAAETLTMVTNDQGNAGSGGALSDTDPVAITVNAVNDPPVAIGHSYTPGAVQANMKITGLTGLLTGASDPDTGDGAYSATLTTPQADVSATSPAGGTVTITDATTGTFSFDPPPGATGDVTFTYKVCDTGNPASVQCSSAQTVTVNVAGPVIWFVDGTNGDDTTGKGTLALPYKTIAKVDNIPDAANQGIFLYSGTYANGITLNASEKLIGQGVTGASFDSVFGITAPSGTIARPSINGTRPAVQGTVGVAASDTVRGLNVAPGAGTGISGSSATGLTINDADVTATGGPALNLSASGGTITLGNLTSTNSSAQGVFLDNFNGSVSATTTTSTNPTTAGIVVQNAPGGSSFSFGATTSNTSGGTGVSLASNGGTVTFGDLDIAPDSGQRALQSTSSTGLITTTSGTLTTTNNTAVEITGATSASKTPLNMQLTTVNTTGGGVAPNGILLQNTSASGGPGGFRVLGTGGSCDAGTTTCTGGRITNTSGGNGATGGNGVYLNTVDKVVLTRMHIDGHPNFAIRGFTVTGFTLDTSLVDGTNGNDAASFEGSVVFDGLFGTAAGSNANSITSSTIKGGWGDNIRVTNTSGTSELTVSGSTIRDTNTGTNGNDNLHIDAHQSANINVHAVNNTFAATNGDHIQTIGDEQSTLSIVATGNTLSAGGGANALGEGITISGGDAAPVDSTETVRFNISNNTMSGTLAGGSINVNEGSGNGNWQGQVSGNTIGTAGSAGSGCLGCSDIRVENHAKGTLTAIVNGNFAHQWGSAQGITFSAGDTSATGLTNGALNLTVTSNLVDTPLNSPPGHVPDHGIQLNGGTQIGNTNQICLDLKSNNATGNVAQGGVDYRVRQRMNTTVFLPGYGGANNDNAAVQAYILARPNTASGSGTASAANNVAGGGGGFQNAGAACAQPAVPT